MPNKNKTACKRRIRSQRSQRRRYRTARNGGWSPLRPFRVASDTRRTNNEPAKFWLSPRRWYAERQTRSNLANQIAGVKTYNNTQAQLSTHNAKFNERVELNKQIRTVNALIDDRTRPLTREQRIFFIKKRDHLRTALQTLNSNTIAAYNTVPAAAAADYSQRMPL